jgi:NAD kinase
MTASAENMTASAENKIVLVVRPTRLDDLVVRHNTIQQAQFYVEHLGADFSDYLAEHRRYHDAVGKAESLLRDLGRVQRLQRRYLANFIFGPEDTVVVLGQDGLVANTLKYLDGQHVVGVNPDPARWDGVLLPFIVDDLPRIIPEELQRKRAVKTVTMAKATLNNGQTLHAVNDLFVGQRSHVSARYKIVVAGHEEQQSSSGIIVSTGLGSTGWLRSVYAGWAAATRTLLDHKVETRNEGAFAWDADYLHYFVREPFPSRTTQANIVIGRIAHADRMTIVSQMAENGVIFSDGIESDYLEFNSGSLAIISVAEKQGLLTV